MSKNRYKQAKKVFSISLGSRDRAFESPHSDQNPLKSVDFRGFFLFIVYCGAEFEECRYGKKCDNSML